MSSSDWPYTHSQYWDKTGDKICKTDNHLFVLIDPNDEEIGYICSRCGELDIE